ncbi:uncharacterized protein TA15573 [Theileria annulata]|uniref:Uncharacterized protein n=1 Tax=Theileria annulata TaxID=5874 RepID=Q4UFK3_THEAN|nr:uncharacterized protein TA15573 [Theileria annulata]CAI74113.1 hypothetical protein TA15573 [Theileria annulata]|eukprot:XP_951845.1 hypothetical protein TA15573 [Theileria annulata]
MYYGPEIPEELWIKPQKPIGFFGKNNCIQLFLYGACSSSSNNHYLVISLRSSLTPERGLLSYTVIYLTVNPLWGYCLTKHRNGCIVSPEGKYMKSRRAIVIRARRRKYLKTIYYFVRRKYKEYIKNSRNISELMYWKYKLDSLPKDSSSTKFHHYCPISGTLRCLQQLYPQRGFFSYIAPPGLP